jgi:hypothetical protein
MAAEAPKKPMLEGSGYIVKKKQKKRSFLATAHTLKGFYQPRLEFPLWVKSSIYTS